MRCLGQYDPNVASAQVVEEVREVSGCRLQRGDVHLAVRPQAEDQDHLYPQLPGRGEEDGASHPPAEFAVYRQARDGARENPIDPAEGTAGDGSILEIEKDQDVSCDLFEGVRRRLGHPSAASRRGGRVTTRIRSRMALTKRVAAPRPQG